MYYVKFETYQEKKEHTFNVDDESIKDFIYCFDKEKIFWNKQENYAVFLNKTHILRLDVAKAAEQPQVDKKSEQLPER